MEKLIIEVATGHVDVQPLSAEEKEHLAEAAAQGEAVRAEEEERQARTIATIQQLAAATGLDPVQLATALGYGDILPSE